MRVDPGLLHEGMTVRNPQGDKIGRIVATRPDGWFVIRRGFILRDEFPAQAQDLVDVRGDDVFLQMRGTIPGERHEGRNAGSRGKEVAERTDERLV